MVERYSQGSLKWVNASNPTIEEVHAIMEECGIPPQLMGDFRAPVPRSGVASLDGVLKVTLDFPIVKRSDIDHPHEIKFIITKKCLVTAHYEDMEALDRFEREFEVLTTLGKASEKATGAHIFLSLMNVLYSVSESKLDYVESKLREIEDEIFRGKEKAMVVEISSVAKKLIAFRQTIKSHDEVLRDAKPLFDALFKEDLNDEFQTTHTHYFYILRRMSGLFETLDGLRETNMALLTTKQNEIMKTLTIMAFITFPLTLFSSMFGMNTESTPIIGREGDFWIILAAMAGAAVCFFIYFKMKRWM